MTPITTVGRLLECSNTFSISALPFLISRMREILTDFDTLYAPDVVCLARDALLEAINKRLNKHLTDGSQPSIQAALLHPTFCGRLHDWCTAEALLDAYGNLQVWLQELDDLQKSNRLAARDDEDDEDDVPLLRSRDWFADVPREPAVEGLQLQKTTLHELITRLRTVTHMQQYPLPALNRESYKACVNDALCEFYEKAAFQTMAPLVRCILTVSASSAGAERAFSSAGRTDSAFRARMSDDLLERITVVQQHLSTTNTPTQITEFANEVARTFVIE